MRAEHKYIVLNNPEKYEDDLKHIISLNIGKIDIIDPFGKMKFKSKKQVVSYSIFIGAVIGLLLALGFQYYAQTVYYPLNIGGRAIFSFIPSIPVTFEFAALCAFLFGLFAFIIKTKSFTWLKKIPDDLIGKNPDAIILDCNDLDDDMYNSIKDLLHIESKIEAD